MAEEEEEEEQVKKMGDRKDSLQHEQVGARDCDIGRLTRTVEYMMYGFVTRVKVWENWRICGINSVSPTGWTFDGRTCRMVIAKKTCQVLRHKQFKMISDR